MRILFYIEPWVQMKRPFLRDVWVFLHSYRPIENLNLYTSTAGLPPIEFHIMLGDTVQASLEEKRLTAPDNVTFSVIKQSDLTPIFENYKIALQTWLDESYNKHQIDAMSALASSHLNGFKPDIIISFTPAPFLKQLFPDTLLLYKEYGIFSRAPYPESWFLDACGIGKNSFLVKHRDILNKLSTTPEKTAFLDKIRIIYRQSSPADQNPFYELVDKERKRYKYLLLAPLQVSDCYMFFAHCEFNNQFDYLYNILENISEDIGIIVTQHPDFPELTDSQLMFLKSRFGNLISYDAFNNFYGASQFLVDSVDGVITVNSSVGLQALFWNKPLFCIGNSHLSALSEHIDVSNIYDFLELNNIPDNDGLLYYLLTHYYITESYYWDGKWLADFLSRSIERYQSKNIDFNFYDQIDQPENIANNIHKHSRLGEMGKPLRLRLHQNTRPRA